MQRLKCCVIGNAGVGKTSMINAFLNNSVENTQTTMGIDFFSTNVYVRNASVRLSIWDTAGAERYRSLMHSYIRDAQIILIVYDITAKNLPIVQWLRIAEQYKPAVIGIVGNKDDLTSVVSMQTMSEIVAPWERHPWMMVSETCSSRKPDSVRKVILKCLEKALHPAAPRPTEPTYITFLPEKARRKQQCCT